VPHRWLARFDAEGEAGWWTAPQPHGSPRSTPAEVEVGALKRREEHRRRQD
jgi:hypothetical protein